MKWPLYSPITCLWCALYALIPSGIYLWDVKGPGSCKAATIISKIYWETQKAHNLNCYFFFTLYYCSNNLIFPWGTGCHWLNRWRAPKCFVKVRKTWEVGRLLDDISKESSGYKGMQMLARIINTQLLRLLIHSLNKYLLNTYYLLS